MKCARCSAELPSQSQFCLRCGTPINASRALNPTTAVTPSAFAAAPAQNNNRRLMMAVAALALLVLALGAFVIHGQMVQAPVSTSGSGLVQAPGATNVAPLVQAPVAPQKVAPVVQTPTEPAPTPQPTDIMDYLAFLKRVEISKQDLYHREEADAQTMLTTMPVDQIKAFLANTDNPSPSGDPSNGKKEAAELNKKMAAIQADWDKLAAFFNTRTPPPSCRDLHDKYFDHLGKTESSIVKIYNILSKVQTDPNAALAEINQMKGQSGDIDSAAVSADRSLADVCTQYHLTKDFDIKTDQGGADVGNMFKGLGL